MLITSESHFWEELFFFTRGKLKGKWHGWWFGNSRGNRVTGVLRRRGEDMQNGKKNKAKGRTLRRKESSPSGTGRTGVSLWGDEGVGAAQLGSDLWLLIVITEI